MRNLLHKNYFFPCYSSPLYVSLSWGGDLDDDGKRISYSTYQPFFNNELGFSLGLFLWFKGKTARLG